MTIKEFIGGFLSNFRAARYCECAKIGLVYENERTD